MLNANNMTIAREIKYNIIYDHSSYTSQILIKCIILINLCNSSIFRALIEQISFFMASYRILDCGKAIIIYLPPHDFK